MRIGLISDIHANLPALDAVLRQMPDVDLLACCGDIVGYYAEPNEVCERLRARGVVCVRGNHDAYVLGALTPNPERRAAYRTDWTREHLTSNNLDWLAALPIERRIESQGMTVILRHANCWDEETYLYEDDLGLFDIQLQDGEILAVGHTHHPLAWRAGHGLLVNPGSVGQPRDWNPRASYALLNLPSMRVEFERVSYDVAALQKELARRLWDPKTIQLLGRRR